MPTKKGRRIAFKGWVVVVLLGILMDVKMGVGFRIVTMGVQMHLRRTKGARSTLRPSNTSISATENSKPRNRRGNRHA